MNQNVYFPGATVKAVGKYSWEIKSWNPQHNSENGKMVVDIDQFNVENAETASRKPKRLRHEVILIPIE